MAHYNARERLYRSAETAARKSTYVQRRKCFISYHADDALEVAAFIDRFSDAFIPRVIGVSDSDPFVNSDDADYVLDRIRETYLTDSSVTIVLVGKCTWARKYVDWEVASTLRNDKINRRSGLLAIELPSRREGSLPARVDDNIIRDSDGNDVGYARWNVYPGSDSVLRAWIEDRADARTSRAHLIKNSRPRRMNNSPCS